MKSASCSLSHKQKQRDFAVHRVDVKAPEVLSVLLIDPDRARLIQIKIKQDRVSLVDEEETQHLRIWRLFNSTQEVWIKIRRYKDDINFELPFPTGQKAI